MDFFFKAGWAEDDLLNDIRARGRIDLADRVAQQGVDEAALPGFDFAHDDEKKGLVQS